MTGLRSATGVWCCLLVVVLSGCATPAPVRETHTQLRRAIDAGMTDAVTLLQAFADDLQLGAVRLALAHARARVGEGGDPARAAAELDGLEVALTTALPEKVRGWRAKTALAMTNLRLALRLHAIVGRFLGRSGLSLSPEEKAALQQEAGQLVERLNQQRVDAKLDALREENAALKAAAEGPE